MSRIGNLLRRNSKFIVMCVIAGFAAGSFYATVVFKPVYKSTAKLLIKPPEKTVFIGYKQDILKNKILILTQMEVLRSDQLARVVWKDIREKNKLKIEDEKGIKLIKKAIYVKNPVNTNILNITASWENPLIAKEIAKSAVAVYEELNVNISKKDVVKNLEAIEKKRQEAEKELLNIRNDIKNFRKNNLLIDLKMEAGNINSQIQTFEKKQRKLDMAAALEVNKIGVIARNLGLEKYNPKNPVGMVIPKQKWFSEMRSGSEYFSLVPELGNPELIEGSVISENRITNSYPTYYNNANYTNFSTKLEVLQDELASLTARYTDAHPAVIKLKSRINRLEEQIQKQIKLTFGNLNNNQNLIESDPVKMWLVENLISSEFNYTDFKAQSRELGEVLVGLKRQKAEIPQKQFTMVNYLQQEKTWANIVNNLREKQVEAEVMESGMTTNIRIVDRPLTPFSYAFPGRGELVSLFMLFSWLLASTFIIGTDVLKNNYDTPEQIEKDLNLPILGVIPWLDREFYDEPDIMFAIEETASFYSLAYQKAVSGMRIKGYNSDKKVLAFTSAGFSKVRSTVIMNLAYGLNRTGQSVIVVDADFRTPSIGKELGFEASHKYSLVELLTAISKDIRDKDFFDEEKINLYTRSISKVDNFFIIPNSGNVSDPGEFIYSEAFNRLIKSLKNKYDWVLVDTPPAMAVPDALTIGSCVDGMIIVTGLDVNKAILRKIYRQFKNYNINIFGVIARELQNTETISTNTYIKQMFARMMQTREGVLIE